MNMMKLLAIGGVLVALAGCEKEVEIRSPDFYAQNEDITKEVLDECNSGKKMSEAEDKNCFNANIGLSKIKAARVLRANLGLSDEEMEELNKQAEEMKKEMGI